MRGEVAYSRLVRPNVEFRGARAATPEAKRPRLPGVRSNVVLERTAADDYRIMQQMLKTTMPDRFGWRHRLPPRTHIEATP